MGMANKLYAMEQLTEEVARDIAAKPEEWMRFLDTASRLYKYTFDEQLLIFAQRPEATAVASMEVWNADAVVHKENANAQGFQLSRVANGVQDVSGEPADLFRDNQLEFAHFGIADHAVELGSLLCTGAGDALVGVDPVQLPVRLAVNVLLEVPLLGFKGVCLIVLVRGHPTIACNINHVWAC